MTLPPRLVLTAALAATFALGSGCAGEPPPPLEGERLDEDDLIVTVSTGDTVDLGEYLEDGQFTVVEFYADW